MLISRFRSQTPLWLSDLSCITALLDQCGKLIRNANVVRQNAMDQNMNPLKTCSTVKGTVSEIRKQTERTPVNLRLVLSEEIVQYRGLRYMQKFITA